ncbi:MAG TPA: phosphoribosylformylglycinamidine synthase subunit PurQ [Acidimicrobiales bacterium]|nr:phosphoribosylformylglycinamidine synthase subunit PurQ [Acidimicrobiales bacterium]
MTCRTAVVVFPGTNCEHDVCEALERVGAGPELVWHAAGSLAGYDAVVLPGGFAHGDYLRPGAIARFSPVMAAVAELAAAGAPVIGICNGFQVLTEAHLLPGALQKNKGLTFLCQMTELEVANEHSALTAGLAAGQRLRIPINHFEGNYTAPAAQLAELEAERRVVLRYVANPNGAAHDIAGICNKEGNVVGLMPHPERASSELLGSADGLLLLGALLAFAKGPARPAPVAPEAAAAAR